MHGTLHQGQHFELYSLCYGPMGSQWSSGSAAVMLRVSRGQYKGRHGMLLVAPSRVELVLETTDVITSDVEQSLFCLLLQNKCNEHLQSSKLGQPIDLTTE